MAPGEVGDFELLPGHVPMLTALKPGVLIIGKRSVYAVSSGYLRVDPAGAVEILVEQALPASEIDVAAAKSEQTTAEAEIAKWADKAQDGDYQNLKVRSAWAEARVKASERAAH
jgi:F-type H+-transporting ATPase subunit epsilon